MGGPSCSASNYFADAGFEDDFLKKHFLYLLYSATQKNLFWLLLLISMRHDLNKNWKKRGCIPKLKCLENVKLQSAASKRYSYSRSIHHQSNINWTILSTVRLIETREEMNCTFKYRAHSWPQILEVKLKKQRLETISINSWKRAFRLCFIKQVFTRALSWGAAAFYGKTKSANRCRISINKNKYDTKKIF